MHQVRARRAAKRDKRYAGQRHTAKVWANRMTAKVDREIRIRMRQKKG